MSIVPQKIPSSVIFGHNHLEVGEIHVIYGSLIFRQLNFPRDDGLVRESDDGTSVWPLVSLGSAKADSINENLQPFEPDRISLLAKSVNLVLEVSHVAFASI